MATVVAALPPTRHPLQAGFSLLELLVVMLLIGIVAGAAGLSISGGTQLRAREEAGRLQESLQLAADEAVFQNAEIGMQPTPNSYRFLRYDTAHNIWHPMPETAFRLHTLPDTLALSLVLEGKPMSLLKEDAAATPAIILLSTGEATPFSLTLSGEHNDQVFTLLSDGIAPISLREDTVHD